jgi:hypothetical protein
MLSAISRTSCRWPSVSNEVVKSTPMGREFATSGSRRVTIVHGDGCGRPFSRRPRHWNRRRQMRPAEVRGLLVRAESRLTHNACAAHDQLMCTCASTKPGTTPQAAGVEHFAPAAADRMSAFAPMAAIRPRRTNTACASGPAVSRVITRPFTIARSSIHRAASLGDSCELATAREPTGCAAHPAGNAYQAGIPIPKPPIHRVVASVLLLPFTEPP